MTEMADKVAKAIGLAFTTRLTNNLHPYESVLAPDAAEALALAAIAAMREPTPEMIAATRDGEAARGYWVNMIDAALTGTAA